MVSYDNHKLLKPSRNIPPEFLFISLTHFKESIALFRPIWVIERMEISKMLLHIGLALFVISSSFLTAR